MLFKKRNVIDIFGLLKLFGFLLVRPIALPKPAHALEPPALSMPLKTHNIVVVGASYAGSSVAHIFLKHVYPELPKTGAKYHVYLINPSTTFYHRSASPRAAASLDLTKNIKLFSDLPSGFKQYGSDIFTFMRGAATAMDTRKRTIKINRAEGGETVIQYHALVLATGISTYAPILSTYQTSLEELQKTILDMNSKVKAAKSIIISGGGPSAVELAGEIGEYLNGAAGWFADRPSNPQAKITLIAGADKLLPILSQRFSDWAEDLLKRVGVDVVYALRTTGTQENAAGKTLVHLDNDTTMECDLFIPAMGVKPNTGFVPNELLNKKGYIKTNGSTLRVDEAGPRVYCLGDVGSYTRGGLIDLIEAVPAAMTNMKRDLLAAHSDPHAKPTGLDKEYKTIAEETQLIPIGQTRGLGAFSGFKLPYFMTYHFKVKDYFDCGHEFASGSRWVKTRI
jgi:NADH dehydrogenase FAD-containing subunit